MNPQINLSLNAETPKRDASGLCVGISFDGRTEVRQLSYFQTLPSIPTTALNDSVMSSCDCSAEKCKSVGWQGKPVTPIEPNPTQQRAVINNGDKQHCLAWSLTGSCFVLKKEVLQ